MELLIPKEIERRWQQELEDTESNDENTCLGGFKAWQDIQASRDIAFEDSIGVRQGTSGVVIGNFVDGYHVTVKFDKREDDSELCVNVLPEALMVPLPGNFRLGQRVAAAFNLMVGDSIGVRLGSGGQVVGPVGKDRLAVLFDERLDSGSGTVSVNCREVLPMRKLVGGFSLVQDVQAAMDLVVASRVVVKVGTRGVVVGEYSDTRLTVSFNSPNGENTSFNVIPLEIKPWCEPPSFLPAGHPVQATKDLLNMNSVVVKAGTRGTVLGGVDSTRIMVLFDTEWEGGAVSRCMTVELNAVG